MSLKQLLLIVSSATALCWIAWIFVIFEVDPATSGWVGMLLFYISFLASLLGTFFIISLLIRKFSNQADLEYQLVSRSFRQSFFLALLADGLLWLQSKHLLLWWNLVILVIAVGILEYFFLAFKNSKQNNKPAPERSDIEMIPPEF